MNKNELFESISQYFTQNDLIVEKDKQFESPEFTADLFAVKLGTRMAKGRNDYYFIQDADKQECSSIEKKEEIHQAARTWANNQYAMPKFLRLKIPNIASIFVSEKGFDEETIIWAKKNRRTMIGGEYHCVYVMDLSTNTLSGPGVSSFRFGASRQKITFKRIDPQNRILRFLSAFWTSLK
ncbi:MAG: hypothetical protein ACLFR1_04865 [Spirochaetia bacterium]